MLLFSVVTNACTVPEANLMRSLNVLCVAEVKRSSLDWSMALFDELEWRSKWSSDERSDTLHEVHTRPQKRCSLPLYSTFTVSLTSGDGLSFGRKGSVPYLREFIDSSQEDVSGSR